MRELLLVFLILPAFPITTVANPTSSFWGGFVQPVKQIFAKILPPYHQVSEEEKVAEVSEEEKVSEVSEKMASEATGDLVDIFGCNCGNFSGKAYISAEECKKKNEVHQSRIVGGHQVVKKCMSRPWMVFIKIQDTAGHHFHCD